MNYGKLYTAGLHANERAATTEAFMRVQHKFDSSIFEMLDVSKRL